jgi:hypothetical protein
MNKQTNKQTDKQTNKQTNTGFGAAQPVEDVPPHSLPFFLNFASRSPRHSSCDDQRHSQPADARAERAEAQPVLDTDLAEENVLR